MGYRVSAGLLVCVVMSGLVVAVESAASSAHAACFLAHHGKEATRAIVRHDGAKGELMT